MSIHHKVMHRSQFECFFSLTLQPGDPDFVSLKLRFVEGGARRILHATS